MDLDCFKFFLVSPNKTTRGLVSKIISRHSLVDVLEGIFCQKLCC